MSHTTRHVYSSLRTYIYIYIYAALHAFADALCAPSLKRSFFVELETASGAASVVRASQYVESTYLTASSGPGSGPLCIQATTRITWFRWTSLLGGSHANMTGFGEHWEMLYMDIYGQC